MYRREAVFAPTALFRYTKIRMRLVRKQHIRRLPPQYTAMKKLLFCLTLSGCLLYAASGTCGTAVFVDVPESEQRPASVDAHIATQKEQAEAQKAAQDQKAEQEKQNQAKTSPATGTSAPTQQARPQTTAPQQAKPGADVLSPNQASSQAKAGPRTDSPPPPDGAQTEKAEGNPAIALRQNTSQPKEETYYPYLAFRYMQGEMTISKHSLDIQESAGPTSLRQGQSVDISDKSLDGNSYSIAFGLMDRDKKFAVSLRPELEVIIHNYGDMQQNTYKDLYLANNSLVPTKTTTELDVDYHVSVMFNFWLDVPVWELRPYIGGTLGVGFMGYDYSVQVTGPSNQSYLSKHTSSENDLTLYAGAGGGIYTVLFDRVMVDAYARYIWTDIREIEFGSGSLPDYKAQFRTPITVFGLSLGVVF